MPFNSQKLVKLLKERGVRAKDFFENVYPERSGNPSFHDIEKNKNPKADTIERIADYLGCSIDDLFDRDTTHSTNHVMGDNNTVGSNITISNDPNVLTATITYLHDIIARQDKTIADQNRRIDQLIELANRGLNISDKSETNPDPSKKS